MKIQNILAQLLIQNPPENYIKAVNKMTKWLNSNIQCESICLIDDEKCNNDKISINKNEAINSHTISKSMYLKKISNRSKVKIIQEDYKNPLKQEVKDKGISKVSIFPGFCKYHDMKIFEPIESSKINNYDDEQIFLFCLRAVAYSRYLSEKRYKECKFLYNSKKNPLFVDVIKEKINFDFYIKAILNSHSKLNKVKIYRKIHSVWYYLKIIFQLKQAYKVNFDDYKAFDNATRLLIKRLDNTSKQYFKYKVFKCDKNNIAFSLTFHIPNPNRNSMIFLTILPSENSSDILIACFNEDYNYIVKDDFGKKCFEGDFNTIEKLIHLEKEAIIFNGNKYNDNSYEKYIYETDDPIQNMFPPKIF